MKMFDFAEITNDMSEIEILNYYRNLYYTEPQVTERGIVANAINDMFDFINRQKAEIERLNKKVEELSDVLSGTIRIRYAKAKSEAYKEFADRLKEKSDSHFDYSELFFEISEGDIDNLLKEMVGEEE